MQFWGFFSGFLNSLQVWFHSNWCEECFGGFSSVLLDLVGQLCFFFTLQPNKSVVKSCLSPNKQALERVLRSSSHTIHQVMLWAWSSAGKSKETHPSENISCRWNSPDDTSVPRYKPKNTVWKKPAVQEEDIQPSVQAVWKNMINMIINMNKMYDLFTLINIWYGGYCPFLKPVLWKSLDMFNYFLFYFFCLFFHFIQNFDSLVVFFGGLIF